MFRILFKSSYIWCYITVVRQQSETAQIDKYQKRENEESNNINF